MLRAVKEVSITDLPALLGELEQVRYTAIARLSEPTLPVLREPGRLLPVEEAANRLSISTDYLYRHADNYPFTRRIGGRLLFSSIGIDQFVTSDSRAEIHRKRTKLLPGVRTR